MSVSIARLKVGNGTYQRHVEGVIGVDEEAEGRPARSASPGGPVAVAHAEHHLLERGHARGGGPVAPAAIEVLEEDERELRLVLHRALHPAVLFGQVGRRAGCRLCGYLAVGRSVSVYEEVG